MAGRAFRWWFLAIVIGTALGGFAGFVATSRLLAAPLERLSLVTPVVVLDRAAALRSLPPDAPREAIEQVLSTLRAKADRLAASGYLVLDAGLVVAAPEDVVVGGGREDRDGHEER